jgi:hypothetical protein
MGLTLSFAPLRRQFRNVTKPAKMLHTEFVGT